MYLVSDIFQFNQIGRLVVLAVNLLRLPCFQKHEKKGKKHGAKIKCRTFLKDFISLCSSRPSLNLLRIRPDKHPDEITPNLLPSFFVVIESWTCTL